MEPSEEYTEWIDLTQWPESGSNETVITVFSSGIDGLMKAYSEVFSNIVQALTDGFRVVSASIDEVSKKTQERATGRGMVQNHGPRPATTFDRRGNRRY